MAEDRRKMLQALAAKRKAEAAAGGAHRPKTSSLLSKSSPAPKSTPLSHKPHPKPSAFLKPQKHSPHKKDGRPIIKKKRVEKYDTEDDEDDDEAASDEDSDSEDEHLKKKTPSSKLGTTAKASSLKPFSAKDGQEKRGKPVVKESVKGKRKSKDSSDDDEDDDVGSGDEDERAAGADSDGEGVDAANILPSRTRRRNAQPVHYDFTNMSGDDDDDSD